MRAARAAGDEHQNRGFFNGIQDLRTGCARLWGIAGTPPGSAIERIAGLLRESEEARMVFHTCIELIWGSPAIDNGG